MSSVYRSLSKSKPTAQPRDPHGDDAKPKNRQRLLMLTSRGVTYRHRHLLADLNSLLPHSRKDAKLDTKTQLSQLNELADLYNCNNVMFFEARKGKDLYIWLAKPPNGPTVKMHCQNVHTMEELNFPGNCLKGSRAVLSFDAAFDRHAHTRVLKELLTHTFGIPASSRKVKPFVDHVMGFTLADGKIWIRCYQISETEATKTPAEPSSTTTTSITVPSDNNNGRSSRGETTISLIEIGPRLVLTPIVMLEGSFGGPVIYENKEFVSPNQIRADLRTSKAGRYSRRAESQVERKARHRDLGLRSGEGVRPAVDELDTRVLFA